MRTELLRILVCPRAGEAIEIIDETGLLLLLTGGVARRMRFDRLCRIEAALRLAPAPVLRLAALAAFVVEDAGRLGEKLRLSSHEAKELEALAAVSPAISPALGEAALQVLLYKLGQRLFLGRLQLAWADSGAAPDDEAWGSAAALARNWTRPSFPLGGADLIALGLKPGPELGALLRELEERWAADGFGAGREALLELAKRIR